MVNCEMFYASIYSKEIPIHINDSSDGKSDASGCHSLSVLECRYNIAVAEYRYLYCTLSNKCSIDRRDGSVWCGNSSSSSIQRGLWQSQIVVVVGRSLSYTVLENIR